MVYPKGLRLQIRRESSSTYSYLLCSTFSNVWQIICLDMWVTSPDSGFRFGVCNRWSTNEFINFPKILGFHVRRTTDLWCFSEELPPTTQYFKKIDFIIWSGNFYYIWVVCLCKVCNYGMGWGLYLCHLECRKYCVMFVNPFALWEKATFGKFIVVNQKHIEYAVCPFRLNASNYKMFPIVIKG